MHAANGEFISLADVIRTTVPVVDRAADARLTTPVDPPLCSFSPAGSALPGSAATLGAQAASSPQAVHPPSNLEAANATVTGDVPDDPERQAAVREARLFRAALADAFDQVFADLVRAFAVDVLGRELRLAEVDLAAIARRLIVERSGDEPLRLRVARADASTACELPLVVDDSLEAGDAILECRSGSVDARLLIRLGSVLAVGPR